MTTGSSFGMARFAALARTVEIFPLPFLAAVGFTAWNMSRPDNGAADWFSQAIEPPGACFVAAYFLGLGASLLAQARGFSRTPFVAANLVALTFAAGLLAADRLDGRPWMLFIGLLFLAPLAPFARRGIDPDALWRFNHAFVATGAMAFIATLLFGAGCSLIGGALTYLFGAEIASRAWSNIWLVAFGFVGPVYWLAQMPDPRAGSQANAAPDFLSRATEAIAKFIAVPLLLVMATILHVYAGKIALDATMPRGQLAGISIAFTGALAVTALMVFPARATGGLMVHAFWRFWPWLLVTPLVMLALAVGQRLGQYGLTEQRYLLVLMAAWAAILVVSQAERWRDIRWISGGLGALLVLASLGPWGAFGLPVRWQAEQIRSRLAAAGLLEAGRLARDADAIALPDAERSRVVAATDYLLKQKRLAVLAPIFEGARDDPFAGGKTSDQTRLRAAINTRLGIPETLGGAARVVYRHTARAPWSIPLAGGESLIGPFDIYGGKGTISTLDKAWTADLAGDVLIVTRESDARQARFALDADAGLRAALSVTPQDGEKARPVRVTRVSGDAPVDIWVIMALRQNGLDKPTNGLSFFVLLAAEKP